MIKLYSERQIACIGIILIGFAEIQRFEIWMPKSFAVVLLTCLLSFIAGCRMPSADWTGTWQLNLSQSTFQGPVFAILAEGDGEYRWEEGSTSVDFKCDSHFRLRSDNQLQACFKTGDSDLSLIRKKDGVVSSTYHWSLTDGGRVFTSVVTTFHDGKPPITSRFVSLRVSGGPSFAGRWRDTSYLQEHTTMLVKIDSHVIRLGYPKSDLYLETSLNGAATTVHGPHTQDGTVYSALLVNRREIFTKMEHNGKVSEALLSLSGDGQKIIESWNDPENLSNRSVLIYDKQ